MKHLHCNNTPGKRFASLCLEHCCSGRLITTSSACTRSTFSFHFVPVLQYKTVSGNPLQMEVAAYAVLPMRRLRCTTKRHEYTEALETTAVASGKDKWCSAAQQHAMLHKDFSHHVSQHTLGMISVLTTLTALGLEHPDRLCLCKLEASQSAMACSCCFSAASFAC